MPQRLTSIPRQNVFRVRRNYNTWVANQTLEDYALRFTSKSARRWSSARVTNTCLGAISFLALEAIGASITLKYGFSNSMLAVCVVGLILFLTAIPISVNAARYGIDIDLLTRGASFGYIGSTITSLIYASFTFIFFAIEAAIMAMALQLTLGIPPSIGYVISALVVIPLVTHGITLISRFQLWTQPLWLTLQLLPLAVIVWTDFGAVENWMHYEPTSDRAPRFNLLLFGAAASVLFSLIAQIGEQVDFLRFMPEPNGRKRRWLLSVMASGPGWSVIGMFKVIVGSFLALLALHHGLSILDAADPTQMYLVAFGYITESSNAALLLAGVFVVLSQIKINVTNAYAGSIAWSNFFSRLTHNHPGRVVWLVFNVAIALMLMELGIYQALERILSAFGIVALAWVGSLVADLVINRALGLRPPGIEFKRAYLYDVNPVGVGSMLCATILGLCAYTGLWGEAAKALASFLALATTLVISPFLAWWTQGRYYLARDAEPMPKEDERVTCVVCQFAFESEDMANCPAYNGPICSLCCTLDARCEDVCKKDSRLSDQLHQLTASFLPASWATGIYSQLARYLGLLLVVAGMIAILLAIIYLQLQVETNFNDTTVFTALGKISFILMLICGVLAWMFILVKDSRQVAREESVHQTQLLLEEIEAHEKTDREPQRAKEVAEAANLAKSRYVTGISHELRTPLNAVLGYAQLLERDSQIPENRRENIRLIRRSGEHLADLIEGLLDISKIEAGRLQLNMGKMRLPTVMDQIANMFRMQAQEKGIEFRYVCPHRLPEFVKTDEQRFRQVLINLLSNAIKYTEQGTVTLELIYRGQVAEIAVSDTGVGIDEDDLERIFRPFERIRRPGLPNAPGTGLGLTITRLLVEILGGDIQVISHPGQGSRLKLSLMLSHLLSDTNPPVAEQQIQGYVGDRRAIMVVDDDAAHRGLVNDTLSPLGFVMFEAQDGPTCLEILSQCIPPDLFLLDISMPGMSGWALAENIRTRAINSPIIMISANAREQRPRAEFAPADFTYLVKPMKLARLLETIAQELQLEWIYDSTRSTISCLETSPSLDRDDLPSPAIRAELQKMAGIGYATGIREKLFYLDATNIGSKAFINHMHKLLKEYDFEKIITLLVSFNKSNSN